MDKANKDFLVILALILFVLSCKHDTQGTLSNSQIKKNLSYEIYNQLINELKYMDYTGTFPPPPKKFTTSFTEKDFWAEHDSIIMGYKDSVLKIALNPILFVPNGHNIEKKVRDSAFSELLSKMYTMQERRVDINKLKITSKLHLSILDTLKPDMSWDTRFKDYHVIVSLSTISFSEDLKKAVLIFGVTDSETDSYASLYCLQKENGIWKSFEESLDEANKLYETLK